MINSNRKYSIAYSYNNITSNIIVENYSIEALLIQDKDNNDELLYSCQEYTDDILDLGIGGSMYVPMRDNLGDILIKRLR